MAAVKGDVGKIMFENAGGTEADISGLRSWSLSITKDTQETTVLGNTSKSFVGGLISGEGSAELIYDPSGNSDYQAFIDDVLVTGDAGDALFELFPDSASGSAKINFSGLITSFEQSSSLGDVSTISITFKPSGTITSAI